MPIILSAMRPRMSPVRRCLRGTSVDVRSPARLQRSAVRVQAKKGSTPSKKAGPPPPPPPPPPATDEATASASEDEGAKVALERLLDMDPAEADVNEIMAVGKDALAEFETLATVTEAAQKEVKDTKHKMEMLKDQYRRLQADFDNFRSRSDEEKAKVGRNVKSSVIQDLLPLVDNFELAAQQIKPATPAEEKINDSYQGLYRQMVDAFKAMGLEAIPTTGTVFDPELHDGIMKEETEEEEDGTILEEFRKGFTFSGKLLRPAMVKVAVNSSGSSASASASDAPSSSEEAAPETASQEK